MMLYIDLELLLCLSGIGQSKKLVPLIQTLNTAETPICPGYELKFLSLLFVVGAKTK